MTPSFLVLSVLVADTSGPITTMNQVHPPVQHVWRRGVGQRRAIVLIHGMHVFCRGHIAVSQPKLADWQSSQSPAVRVLSNWGDIYTFAYGQDFPVEQVANRSVLRSGIRRLSKMGYREIVLVGHSAGGLVARQFVEDNPSSGVTAVVQICSPNGGCGKTRWQFLACQHQRPFIVSMSPEDRDIFLRKRTSKRIPRSVHFVCIVGRFIGSGDGVVACKRQWSEDLQRQHIPAIVVRARHETAMRNRDVLRIITQSFGSCPYRLTASQLTRRRLSLHPKTGHNLDDFRFRD